MINLDKVYLTVTALTKYIKFKFDHDVHLNHVLLKGEISNFKHHSRGHFYFTIKDEFAQITAVMFASYAKNVKFEPVEGQKVLVEGRVLVYEANGNYQINVEKLEADGIGSLYLAYEQLKKELQEKGLFNPEHKKPIPRFPKAIGVVTSKTGAAVRDIINTINRRYPYTMVYIYPCLVQGENAKEDIVRQIEKANREKLVDVLIVGRGGGSIEDLWAFNEKIVAYAIYNSEIPIISGVGHEIDFTIADFVADLRAPTPTAAAELATPDRRKVLEYITQLAHSLSKDIDKILEGYKMKLLNLDERLENRNPLVILSNYQKSFLDLFNRLNNAMRMTIERYDNGISLLNKSLAFYEPLEKIKQYDIALANNLSLLKHSFEKIYTKNKNDYLVLISKLEALNPLSLMKKGYSIAYVKDKVITKVSDVNINDELDLKVTDGEILCQVIGGKQNGN